MTYHINSIHFDNFFDVTLDMETYFSLSLPIPQSVFSRDEEINYWKDYINGQYHDLNMVFGLEIDDRTYYENQGQRLALEFEMRGKKYAAVSGIIQSLSNITRYDAALSHAIPSLIMHFGSRLWRDFLFRFHPVFTPLLEVLAKEPQVSHQRDQN